MRTSKIKGPIPGTTPQIKAFGTPTTDDLYALEVTAGGPGGTAEITITSDEDDGVAAATVNSGTPFDLGTGGGKILLVFDRLAAGDIWTVKTHASGVIEQPVGVISNTGGQYAAAGVGSDGGVLTRGAPSGTIQIIDAAASLAGDSFECSGCRGLMLRVPAGWDDADIGFQQAAWPGGSFADVYAGGSRVKMSVEAGKDCAAPREVVQALYSAFYVKLESLNRETGAAETQSSEASIIVQITR